MLSWHFGITQHFTSIGSHNNYGDENSENKDHIVRLYPGLINKSGILRMNMTNIIMSLTRVIVDNNVMADDVSINL